MAWQDSEFFISLEVYGIPVNSIRNSISTKYAVFSGKLAHTFARVCVHVQRNAFRPSHVSGRGIIIRYQIIITELIDKSQDADVSLIAPSGKAVAGRSFPRCFRFFSSHFTSLGSVSRQEA